jgi:hypothetical protein
MAKVHDSWGMWQGSQNLCLTQNESRAQTKQMTAVGYISDPEDIIKASQHNFQTDGAAAFTMFERSPVPQALYEKELAGGYTQVLNISRIRQLDCHSAESDEDCAPESISDTQNWLDWNGDLDDPNISEDDWEADIESEIELENAIEDTEMPEHWNVSAAPNVPGLIRLTRRPKKIVEKQFMMANTMETSTTEGIKKKSDRMGQCIINRFFI